MTTSDVLDHYLVLAGPKSAAATSRGSTRPWRIDNVYLFDAHLILGTLQERGSQIGIASSVRAEHWQTAEFFPSQSNDALPVTDDQARILRLFAPAD